jgi:hypothetical protein
MLFLGGRAHCSAPTHRQPKFGERIGQSARVDPFGSRRCNVYNLSAGPHRPVQTIQNRMDRSAGDVRSSTSWQSHACSNSGTRFEPIHPLLVLYSTLHKSLRHLEVSLGTVSPACVRGQPAPWYVYTRRGYEYWTARGRAPRVRQRARGSHTPPSRTSSSSSEATLPCLVSLSSPVPTRPPGLTRSRIIDPVACCGRGGQYTSSDTKQNSGCSTCCH